MNRFLRFCAVGGIGFLIDAGILQALVVGVNANPYAARVASFIAAATGTWLMNRRYTFEVGQKPTRAEWFRYVVFMLFGASVNYGVFALSIACGSVAHAQPWIGVAFGSIAGLWVNFTTSRILFRQETSD